MTVLCFCGNVQWNRGRPLLSVLETGLEAYERLVWQADMKQPKCLESMIGWKQRLQLFQAMPGWQAESADTTLVLPGGEAGQHRDQERGCRTR